MQLEEAQEIRDAALRGERPAADQYLAMLGYQPMLVAEQEGQWIAVTSKQITLDPFDHQPIAPRMARIESARQTPQDAVAAVLKSILL